MCLTPTADFDLSYEVLNHWTIIISSMHGPSMNFMYLA